MDWVTRDRLDAASKTDTPQAITPARSKPLGLPNREAIALPAADGKRVLGSKHTVQPCVSYTVDDPTPRLFAPARERHGSKRTEVRAAVAPEVVRAGLTNNIGADYS